jgi:hypothetical protein
LPGSAAAEAGIEVRKRIQPQKKAASMFKDLCGIPIDGLVWLAIHWRQFESEAVHG